MIIPDVRRVLLVEDEPDMRAALREMLENENLQVVEAENGAEALKILEKDSRFHLTLCDLQMPVMDGHGFLRQCRLKHSDLTIAVLTAFTETEKLVRALQLGAVDYLTKPFDSETIVNKIYLLTEIGAARLSGDTAEAARKQNLLRVKNSVEFGKKNS